MSNSMESMFGITRVVSRAQGPQPRKRALVTLGGQPIKSDDIDVMLDPLTDPSLLPVAIQLLTVDQVDKQEKLGNPAVRWIIDSKELGQKAELRSGRPPPTLSTVKRRAEVLFGNTGVWRVMQSIEQELAIAIAAKTKIRTGKLRRIKSMWQWEYIPGDERPSGITTVDLARGIIMRGYDMVILKPNNRWINDLLDSGERRAYATIVNNVVGKRDGQGFFGFASQRVKRRPDVKRDWTVWAGQTVKYVQSGATEASRRGGQPAQGYIAIMARKSRYANLGRGYRR